MGKLAKPSYQMVVKRALRIRNQSSPVLPLSHSSDGTFARRAPGAPGIQINVPSIPMLYPKHHSHKMQRELPCLEASQGATGAHRRLKAEKNQRVSFYPPPPGPSTPKVRKTTVGRAHVLRQARACMRRAVPKERMSPKTYQYLVLTTIVATGNYNTMCRQILLPSAVHLEERLTVSQSVPEPASRQSDRYTQFGFFVSGRCSPNQRRGPSPQSGQWPSGNTAHQRFFRRRFEPRSAEPRSAEFGAAAAAKNQ